MRCPVKLLCNYVTCLSSPACACPHEDRRIAQAGSLKDLTGYILLIVHAS